MHHHAKLQHHLHVRSNKRIGAGEESRLPRGLGKQHRQQVLTARIETSSCESSGTLQKHQSYSSPAASRR